VPQLAALVSHPDPVLKRFVCAALAQIARHTNDLAEVVVEHQIFPKIFKCLKDQDNTVRQNAATCIHQIANKTPELANQIISSEGTQSIVEYISETRGRTRLPGIQTLGKIAEFGEELA